MFILPDGRPISPDVPFELNDISYPDNFLRLASPEEREAIGITEEPDPAPYDQRFYWGPELPKDHTELVKQWTQQTRTTAGTLIQPTDWMVIREQDNGTAVPEAWKTWRQAVRAASELKVSEIEQTADTEALAAYITGADYPAWPLDPNAPVEPPATDGVLPVVDGEDG